MIFYTIRISCYFYKKQLKSWDFKAVRGLGDIKEATVTIGGTDVKMAVVNGGKNFAKVCEEVKAGKSPYHFIEFMACPGGCVMGERAGHHALQ